MRKLIMAALFAAGCALIQIAGTVVAQAAEVVAVRGAGSRMFPTMDSMCAWLKTKGVRCYVGDFAFWQGGTEMMAKRPGNVVCVGQSLGGGAAKSICDWQKMQGKRTKVIAVDPVGCPDGAIIYAAVIAAGCPGAKQLGGGHVGSGYDKRVWNAVLAAAKSF